MKRVGLLSFILVLVVSITGINSAQAQRNFYNRIEIGGGNVWTFVGLEAVSMILNHVTRMPLTEATLRFGVPISEYGNLNGYQGFYDWNYDRFTDNPDYGNGDDGFAKFKGRNLLSNIIIGDKMGYLSDNLGSVNYCVYGSAYYNLQQFKLMSDETNYTNLSTQRLQLGGGLMLILGSIEKKGRFIIDGGVRYNLPLKFNGDGFSSSTNDMMNKGVTSHYMVKYSWDNAIAVGATVDVMHYNMFKDETLCGAQSKMFEFGITLSILLRNYL